MTEEMARKIAAQGVQRAMQKREARKARFQLDKINKMPKVSAAANEEYNHYSTYDIPTAQSELDQLYRDIEVFKGFETAVGIGQGLDKPIYGDDGKEIYFSDYFSKYIGDYDLSTEKGRESALDSINPKTRISELEKELSKARAYQSSKLDTNADFSEHAVSSEAAERALKKEKLDKYFTQSEKNRYYYLFNTEGKERANEYAKDILDDLEGRQIQAMYDYGDDHPFWGSVASVGTNVASMIEGGAKGFEYWVNGGLEELDDVHTARLTNAFRSGASADMGDFGQWAYSTVMSGVDSAIARLIPSGNVLLGISAMANGINDGLDRGLSDDQAFMTGAYQGIFEMFFEGVSFNNLDKVQKWIEGLDAKSWKSVVSRLTATAGLNATEEALTETANILYDTVANGGLSNYSLMVNEYINAGKSPEEAMKAAKADFMKQIGAAAASGAAMGGGMFAGEVGLYYGKNAVDSARYYNQQGKETRALSDADETISAYTEAAKSFGENSKAAKAAAKYEKKDTNYRLGKMVAEVDHRAFKSAPSWKQQKDAIRKAATEDVAVTVQNAQEAAQGTRVDTSSADVRFNALPRLVDFGGMETESIVVEDGNGGQVSLSELSVEDAEIAELYSLATTTGSVENANRFIEQYRLHGEQLTPTEFWNGWIGVLTMGETLTGAGAIDEAYRTYSKFGLSKDAMTAAFISGVELRTSSDKKYSAEQKKYEDAWNEAKQQSTIMKKERVDAPVITIEADSELAKRIESSDKSKYTVIKDYLIEKFGGEEFTLSDGRKAIMDNRDAQELSHKANEARTAQLSNLKNIIESALYDHSETKVEHKKFSAFHYYMVDVVYDNDTFKLWLNVGVAKNDGINHIYSITNRAKEAPTNYGVSRPVGNAIQNASSTDSISHSSQNVKSFDENYSSGKYGQGRSGENAIDLAFKTYAHTGLSKDAVTTAFISGVELRTSSDKKYSAEQKKYEDAWNETRQQSTIMKKERVDAPVITIEADSELAKRIQNSDKSKYTVIRDYLVEKFYGQEFLLSDGKTAIMDKRDAQELSHKADGRKTAELANIRELIETAKLYAEEDQVKHNKFKAFSYYAVTVEFEGQAYDILINVGLAKNDNRFHIYDITNLNTKRRAANRSPIGLSQVTKTGAIKNDSSTDSISHSSQNVKSLEENYSFAKFDDSALRGRRLDKSQQEYRSFLRVFSRATGANIEVFYSKKGERAENGSYNRDTNTMRIDINAGISNKANYEATQSAIVHTLSHESIHNMRVVAPAQYEAIRDFVLDVLRKDEKYDLESAIETEMEKFRKKGEKDKGREDAIEEIVARACEDRLGSSEALRDFMIDLYQHDQKAANGFVKAVREFLARLREFFERISKQKSVTEEAQIIAEKGSDMIAELQKRFDAAVLAMREGNVARNAVKAAETKKSADTAAKVMGKERGVAKDGKKIYESNFPQGTPKAAKSQHILNYIQNVWFKNPIKLVISNGETSRTILAQFDPTVDPNQNIPTDASKLAGGNRHGNHTEQRVTLDLADDYYQIASNAKYNYSKMETGKSSTTHDGVKMWHYFVNDIYFAEYGKSELIPYTITINVKEKDNGAFVYSFNAEKESSTRRTLHAGVNTRKGANGELFLDNSITESDPKVKTKSEKNYEMRSEPAKGIQKRVDTAEKENRLIYKKEESTQGIPQVQYERDINADSSNNRIAHENEKVNTKSEKSSEMKQEREERAEEDFSYDALVTKDDLKVTVIRKNRQVRLTADGSIDTEWILKQAKSKCKIIRTNSSKPTYYVNVPDIGKNVEITNKNIKHGFIKSKTTDKKAYISPKDLLNARVALELPQILSRSIEVNQSSVENNIDVPYRHVMIGSVALEKSDGDLDYYAVRFSVDERRNQNPILAEVNILGRLHAANAKKIDQPTSRGVSNENVALLSGKVYLYSIADFLKDVKGVFNDTFSKDVYEHFGEKRYNDVFSDNLMYQDRIETPEPSVVLRELFSDNKTYEGYGKYAESLEAYKDLMRRVSGREARIREIDAEIAKLRRLRAQSGKETRMDELYRMRKTAESKITEYKNRMFAMEAKELREVVEYETRRIVYKIQRRERDNQDVSITLADVESLRSIGSKSINKFSSDDIKKTEAWAEKFYVELGTKSPFFRAWFGEWRAYDKEQIKIISVPIIDISKVVLEKGNYFIEDTGWNVYAGKTLNDDTRHHSGGNRVNVKALNAIKEILSNSVLLDTIVSERNTKKKSENTAFLHKLYSLIKYGDQLYIAKSTVEEYYNETIGDVSRRAYNLKAIKIEPIGGQLGNNSSSSRPDTSSTISIADLYGFVKSFDKDFSAAHEVNEYLLNKDGTPKVFYHGTNKQFTAFSTEEITANEGLFFFAENREDAQAYGKNVFQVYLTGEKFANYDAQPAEFYRLRNKRAQLQYLKERGYDGWYANMDSDGWGEVSVFLPTQIKSATDNIGTFNKSEDNILYQDRIETPEPSVVLRELFFDNKTYEGYGKYAESLEAYKDLMRRVSGREARIREIDAEIAKLRRLRAQSGKETRMDELYRMRKTAESKITEYKNRMFAMEAKELREVVEYETRRIVYKIQRQERERFAAMSKRRTDDHTKQHYVERTRKTVRELDKLLIRSTKDKNVKNGMQETVAGSLLLADMLFNDELTNEQIAAHGVDSVTEKEAGLLEEYNKLVTARNVLSEELVRAKIIREGMSEEDRYAALKDKKMRVPQAKYSNKDLADISSIEKLNSKAKSKAEKIIIPLAERLGIVGKDLSSPEIDIDFIFSKNKGLAKSLHSQLEYGGTYSDLAKALINLEEILDSAVLIEQHSDKYVGTLRENKNLRGVYVLVGGFIDNGALIPVQLEIKNTTDYGGRLYLTVAMTKIEADVVVSAMDRDPARLLVSASKVSIADIFKNVNPKDKNFLKYVPDGFLSTEQKEAKLQALSEELRKIDGMRKDDSDTTTKKVNTESEISKLEEKLNKVTNRIYTLNMKLSDVFEREKARYRRTGLENAIGELKDAYDSLKSSPDDFIKDSYREEVAERIDELRKDLKGVTVGAMTTEQMRDVYMIYRMVLTTVRNANRLFAEGRSESISEMAQNVRAELLAVGRVKEMDPKAIQGIKSFAWNMLTPVYAFDIMGSKTLCSLFRNLAVAEGQYGKDVQEAQRFKLNMDKEYGADTWEVDKIFTFKTALGKEFKVTLGQIMSIYAYTRRGKEAEAHLDGDGFCHSEAIIVKESKRVPGKVITFSRKYTMNPTSVYKLSPTIRASMISKLDEKQRQYVEAMQNYLSSDLAKKGNRTTMKLYGIELFGVEHYFPLRSAKNFIADKEKLNPGMSPRLRNAGFTKSTVKGANSHVVLDSFLDVWAKHCNDMATYNAFTLPLEDMSKVFNYSKRSTDSTDGISVSATVQGIYGRQAVSYVRTLIDQLNGGARIDNTTGFVNKFMGLAKTGATALSTSTLIQQPTAMLRAMAYIDPKYFATHAQMTVAGHKAEWEEIKKYAPIAIIKEMSGYDTGLGSRTTDYIKSPKYDGPKNKARALITDASYRNEVVFAAPALADELSWCHIWAAVKKETADTTKLNPDTEEFLKECGDRFTDVVMRTQVYDSVLARSALMRSKDTGAKMITPFAAEPTLTANMVAYAIITGKRGNKKVARRILGTAIGTSLVTAVVTAFVYAAWDDDDDESYWEKYIQSVTKEVLEAINPVTYIPFLRDIWSLMIGYDVERLDISVASDVVHSFNALFSGKKTVWDKVSSFAGAVANLFGLPLKNLLRECEAVVNITKMIIELIENGPSTDGEGAVDSLLESLSKSIPVWGHFID